MEIKYIEDERLKTNEGRIFGGISLNGNRKLSISVQSAQSFIPAPKGFLASDGNFLFGYIKFKLLMFFPISVKFLRVSHLKYADSDDPSNLILVLESGLKIQSGGESLSKVCPNTNLFKNFTKSILGSSRKWEILHSAMLPPN